MQRHRLDGPPAAIVTRVRELVGRERTLTFTALTARLSDCRWINLLRALNHLEQQHVIKLTPLPWDYEIRLMTNGPSATKGE
ncbi:hypothetical protein [Nitrospira lenta]|uniref:Uncharacterized protein n=1 Tax=Nitrospira lenta TaxID=1436998 RepID=A0A330LAY6_9BACT|nr:hypothetical protein [Nitrospira lenta]SPP66072.1 hypothetical protein NITLEN_50112 [Nitrospira lenta]